MITPEQIQSIVDGECSHESRALILRSIEHQPSAWRALALALLEEQQWARQVATLAKSTTAVRAEVFDANHPASVQQLVRLSDRDPHGRGRIHPIRIAANWLSVLAASLLLGLGFFGGTLLPTFLPAGPKGSESTSVARSTGQAESIVQTKPFDTNMKMLVSGPNKQTAEIPIYDMNDIDHDVFVAREMYEVARINQRLRKEGFELDVRPEYYTGKLHDGRQLIVPVKQVGLKPYGL